ncbi:aspartate/glutamate racemase family protein [Celeribacter halophilus]|uniref:aspartate/glutamate racemase family protein n=1 Tax=Celeribacter halophilus TaxID=576117 RepID=UPI0026E1960E|nr:aspartate/glutamate racemase family protein [Celeribacter halophilus]MDO6723403.1 aspartate/glutamate racemase family protein [Celeribacter halophilus]
MLTCHGGKTVFGANLGILMLETQFPRIPGDIGNATTWPFPVQFRVVRSATPELVVRNDARELAGLFIEAAKDLVASGCDGITTNCGFLSIVQDKLAEAVPVPVATSSLMQVPMVKAMLPAGKRVGILTISKETLTPAHLNAARVPADTPIVGTEGGRAFTRDILGDAPEIDFTACRLDMLDAARQLVSDHADIGAIVLECTNMTPYAADVRKLTGLPVFSIYSFIHWFQQALVPDRFSAHLDDPLLGLAGVSK